MSSVRAWTTGVGAGTRVSAFDGLRGLAVVAVLLFHAEVSGSSGGFLGVSAFFTLSGFLITSLLLSEQRSEPTESAYAGSGRRAPAGCCRLRSWRSPSSSSSAHSPPTPTKSRDLRGDVFGALGYVANWHFIVDGRAYGALFAQPSPVVHFWSLAIEEQFYVVFPLLLLVGCKVFRGRLWPLAACITAAIIASIALSCVLASDMNRVYYGTDTRAAELLIGALLAIVCTTWSGPRTRTGRVALSAAGFGALALMIFWWCTVHQDDQWLYRGGFALHALLTALVIAAACSADPQRPPPRVRAARRPRPHLVRRLPLPLADLPLAVTRAHGLVIRALARAPARDDAGTRPAVVPLPRGADSAGCVAPACLAAPADASDRVRPRHRRARGDRVATAARVRARAPRSDTAAIAGRRGTGRARTHCGHVPGRGDARGDRSSGRGVPPPPRFGSARTRARRRRFGRHHARTRSRTVVP